MCISSFLCVHSMKNVFLIFVLLTVLMWNCSLGLTKIVKCLYFSTVVSFLLFKSRSPATLPSGSLSKVYWMLGRRLNVINLLRHLTDAFSKFYARPKSTRFSTPVTLCQCLFIYLCCFKWQQFVQNSEDCPVCFRLQPTKLWERGGSLRQFCGKWDINKGIQTNRLLKREQ